MTHFHIGQVLSASAERVFSLLKNAFNDQQDNALKDYLEASVMIRYNNAKRLSTLKFTPL